MIIPCSSAVARSLCVFPDFLHMKQWRWQLHLHREYQPWVSLRRLNSYLHIWNGSLPLPTFVVLGMVPRIELRMREIKVVGVDVIYGQESPTHAYHSGLYFRMIFPDIVDLKQRLNGIVDDEQMNFALGLALEDDRTCAGRNSLSM